jgi:hypothetical protein
MPFFCRHSRIAAKPAGPRPPAGVVALPVEEVPEEEVPVEEVPVEEVPEEEVPEEAPVEAALALEDVVLDEPPHAAKPIQASSRMTRAAAACLRPLVWVWGMELLCR